MTAKKEKVDRSAVRYPTYRELLDPCFNAENGIDGLVIDIEEADYRVGPGISPSDIKMASEELGGYKQRGHLTRLANDKMARWCDRHNKPLPVGVPALRKSKELEFGQVYHCLLLEPDAFNDRFAVLDGEAKAEMIARRTERKKNSSDYPTEFSGRWKESREEKNRLGRELNDEEKATILQDRQTAFLDDCSSWNAHIPEYQEWVSELEATGKMLVSQEDVDLAEAMLDALFNFPDNDEVGELVDRMLSAENRLVEVPVYLNFGFPEDEEIGTIQTKGRPDVMFDDVILDPKTTICCHPETFSKDVESYNYDLSMAGYMWMTRRLAEGGHPSMKGFDFPKVRAGFLAQEKTAPFLARIHWIPEEWLDFKVKSYRNELKRLATIWSKGNWSGEEMEAQEQYLLPTPWLQKLIEHS